MTCTAVTRRALEALADPACLPTKVEENGLIIQLDRVCVHEEIKSVSDLTLDIYIAHRRTAGRETVLKYGGNEILVIAGSDDCQKQ